MTSDEFCLWLQGYFDVTNQSDLKTEQVAIIVSKLKSVGEQPGTTVQTVQTSTGMPIPRSFSSRPLRC